MSLCYSSSAAMTARTSCLIALDTVRPLSDACLTMKSCSSPVSKTVTGFVTRSDSGNVRRPTALVWDVLIPTQYHPGNKSQDILEINPILRLTSGHLIV